MATSASIQRDFLMSKWRTRTQWISVLVGIEIALHSFIVAEPALTMVAAALWIGAGFFWTRRGGRGGPLVIGTLALLEIVATLFFSEELASEGEVAPWILGIHIVLVVVALLTVAMTLVREREA